MEEEDLVMSQPVLPQDNVVVPPPSKQESSNAAARAMGVEPVGDFDYAKFRSEGRVDFSPEYFQQIMSMFKGTDTVKFPDGNSYTKPQVFAIQAVDEINSRYGFGTYKDFKEGTQTYQPGMKFNDEEILEFLTTMEDKGFLDVMGRRLVENVPSTAAFATGFAAGKKAQSILPPSIGRTGIPLIDKTLAPLQTAYVAGKFALPYVTGVASSIASYPLNESFGELVLGDKKLPTPGSYGTQRAAEVTADVISAAPFGFFADKAASNMLSDYLTNRLIYQGTRASKQNPLAGTKILKKNKYDPIKNPQGQLADDASALAQDFDFSELAVKPFGKQYREAIQTISQLGKKGGLPFQGPLPTMEDYAKRGVAGILQGKTAPRTLRMALVAENALKNAGKEARNNKALFAFYEGLAATGAALFTKSAAESNPFSGYETAGEIGGSILAPVGVSLTVGNLVNLTAKGLSATIPNIRDEGFLKGIGTTIRDTSENKRAALGFKQLIGILDEYGEINTAEQRDALIAQLETLPANPKSKPTAGMLTKNVAIMAMEEALAKDFDSLSEAQRIARNQEIEVHRVFLDKLALGEGTDFAKDSLRISAEIEEAIFEGLINNRLSSAETNLFAAYEQVLKSNPETAKKIRLNQTEENPQGERITREGLEMLGAEDRLDLSNRLVDMLMTQKRFGRARQKELYNKAGPIRIDSFYDDDGNEITTPKFIQVLQQAVDGGPIVPQSNLAKDLRQLINFSQSESEALGIGVDLGAENPKLDAYFKARDDAYQQDGMMFFDRFVDGLGPLDDSGLPEEVTPDMIASINSAIQNRKKGSPTTNVFEAYRGALVERGKRQGTIDTRASARTEPTEADVEAASTRLSEIRSQLSEEALETLNEYERQLTPNQLNSRSRIADFLSNELEMLSAQSDPDSIALRNGLEALGEVKRLENSTIRPNPSTVGTSGEGSQYTLSLQKLNQMRSTALDLARDGNLSPSSQRVAGMFATAIEDDLNNFANFGGTEADQNSLKALRTANAFTKAFSNVYYRSYVSDVLKETRQGAFRIAPETLAQSLSTNRFDQNYLKVLDIAQIGQFAQDQGLAGAGETINSIHGVMDKVLRMARAESIDPTTNNISPEKLQQWIKKNERLEGVFPDLFADLKEFEVAKVVLNNTVLDNAKQRSEINKQVNFAALLRDGGGRIRTNPTTAVAEAMAAGKDQLIALDRLLAVIPKTGDDVREQIIYTLTDSETGLKSTFLKRSDAVKARDASSTPLKLSSSKLEVNRENALEGFKSSLFEYLVLGSPGGRGQNKTETGIAILNPTQVYQDLFEKRMVTSAGGRGARNQAKQLTMASWLKKNKVMSERELDLTKSALTKLMEIQAGELTGQLAADFAEAAPLLDFGISIFGSAVGTRTQSIFTGGNSGPGSIIAAGKGAEAARNIFLRMPQHQRMLLAADLLQNPALMAKMLRKYGEEGQREGVLGALSNTLKRAGYSVLPRRIFTGATGEDFESTEGFNPLQKPVDNSAAEEASRRNSFLRRSSEARYDKFNPNEVIGSGPVRQKTSNQSQPVGTPTTQAALPAPQPPMTSGAGTNPQLRQQYAALFPNDPISGMLVQRPRTFRRGGIASLME